MNPVIVIPTYVGGRHREPSYEVVATYDHVTPLTHQGELPRCLASLRDNEIDAPIVLLVVSEPELEKQASAKIREIADAYRAHLRIQVVDAELLNQFYDVTDALGFTHLADGVALTGYGAIRNLGLVIAAVHGFTEVVFIDDDEVVIDPDFLHNALYGLGRLSKKGIPVLVKSGFFLDRTGKWKSSQKQAWYNRFWEQGPLFNAWISKAMAGPRLSSSHNLYGGLMAIHREAFRRVAFDPWISRGEDLDYLLNLKMYGGGVWFDNQWSIQHLPPAERTESQRFRQDIYRWIYEHRKLEFAKTQIDLLQIAPHSLDPYPGPFLDHSITTRVFLTAILRTIGRPRERGGYLKAARASQREAKAYAEVFCARYFEFQSSWPHVLATLEAEPRLKTLFGASVPLSVEDAVTTAASLAAASQPHDAAGFEPSYGVGAYGEGAYGATGYDAGAYDTDAYDAGAYDAGAYDAGVGGWRTDDGRADNGRTDDVAAYDAPYGQRDEWQSAAPSATAARSATAAPSTAAYEPSAPPATSTPAPAPSTPNTSADLLDFELDLRALGVDD